MRRPDPYETDKLLSEYLLFHYGASEDILPYPFGPADALHFPVRSVTECLDVTQLPAKARALDLGCAVGRSSFELARWCPHVLAIDCSRRFIAAAAALAETGQIAYERAEEGRITTPCIARVPVEIERTRVTFAVGDAAQLPAEIGRFDVVLLANLIDRLDHPARCIAQLASIVHPGGQLIITSPYTWLEEFTTLERWLGGFERAGRSIRTFDTLCRLLEPDFTLRATKDLPFLIREHARKYQWSVAQASLWIRRGDVQ
jgi:putative 4-mercaptohistidine N1-methyltranferase